MAAILRASVSRAISDLDIHAIEAGIVPAYADEAESLSTSNCQDWTLRIYYDSKGPGCPHLHT